ncbi:MAG: MipA/OmpV family protein [Betaproteobacteria bacterium]|nr:MipA/OmpV family protein [Betaproteobacteria bacterium]
MRAVLCVLCALVAVPAAAQERPLWELGMGVGAFALPDYRGSDQGRGYALPVPYVVYRGKFLKADRRGIRGELFDSERVELNVSVSASLPVDSTRNAARAGMPDLRPSLELGPSLEFTLWRSREGRELLELRLPVRAAFTLESSPHAIGWVATPNLNLDLPGRGALAGWNFGLLTGPVYGSRRQHEYFYGVAPQFATPARPAYAAPGGYAGVQFLAAASRRFKDFWVGAFVRADTLRGAAFEASPLVKRNTYFAAGVAIAWVLGTSRERVEAPE